ncbi:MAG TPA: hypothetical protein VGM56_18695 [Byssovorax sp.]|jgi:hypothetical protein
MHVRVAFAALALAVFPAVALGPHASPSVAEASVSRLLSLDELVAGATHVVVATPMERKAVWEEIGGSKRIVTYTRIDVARTVLGSAHGSVWVRTLGGAVGNVGQSVAGEAKLTIGQQAVIFLFDAAGVTVVSGRAQGHFPVGADNTLRSSPDVGGLIPQRGPAAVSARDALIGADLEVALGRVTQARADHAR